MRSIYPVPTETSGTNYKVSFTLVIHTLHQGFYWTMEQSGFIMMAFLQGREWYVMEWQIVRTMSVTQPRVSQRRRGKETKCNGIEVVIMV